MDGDVGLGVLLSAGVGLIGFGVRSLVVHWRATATQVEEDERRKRGEVRALISDLTERGHEMLGYGTKGALSVASTAALRGRAIHLPVALRTAAIDLLNAVDRVAPLATRLGQAAMVPSLGSRPMELIHVDGLAESVEALRQALDRWEAVSADSGHTG